MKDKEKLLLGAACFFAGAVAGFLLAPIKNGIYCGNNNGNNYLGKDEEIEKEDDDLEELNKELDAVNEEIKTVKKEINEELIGSIDSIE